MNDHTEDGDFRAEDIFCRLREPEISARFSARHEYKNIMYIHAGVLVEKLMGTPWNVPLKGWLFKPLQMTRSGCSAEELLGTKEYSYSYSSSENGHDRNEFPGPERNSWHYLRASSSVFFIVQGRGAWIAKRA